MAVALSQSIQASAVSSTSIVLPSWSIVLNDIILVAVACRDNNIVPTVAGQGQTFVEIADVETAQGVQRCFLFRAQATANNTGSITVTLTGNSDPVAIAAWRLSGAIVGTNGAAATDALVTDPGPLSDDDDMKTDITTVADNCLVTAFGSYRLATFTAPAGQTILQQIFIGSSGDTTNSAAWRLNGLKTPAGLVTMGADNDLNQNRDWCMIAISIKPFAAPVVGGGLGSAGALSSIFGI